MLIPLLKKEANIETETENIITHLYGETLFIKLTLQIVIESLGSNILGTSMFS